MAKNTDNKCGAPKLRELPAEFTQQISVEVPSSNIISLIMESSLPDLAKRVGKGNSYNNSVNGSVKAINIATAIHDKVNELNEAWDGYRGFKTVLSDVGLLREWRSKRSGCDYDEGVATDDLYENTIAEVHIVFTKKLKDKKFLASKGVK